ncbi:toxin-antitoxin system YwqK family antitoxin [Corallococcus sp. 4LFB]|uniref:toxin-antitoxin system YwqK family antitoxin n=1 Tax=Corallococcus sp. 4LFB TaxID=3383249 RepID=UPI003974C8EA
MSVNVVTRFVVISLVSIAAPSLASEVQLSCPAGTVQKGKTTKNESVYCVKTASTDIKPKLHGPYVDFWPNGQKQSEGLYLNGFRSGHWTYWDANGVKTGETEFVAGDYHGERVQYFANGKPKMIEQYRNGIRNGTVQEMSEDGKVVRESHFEKGKEVAAK